MNAIVAIDEQWSIGKDNELLIRIPDDMAHFRKLTVGKIVIMGRKTLNSLPNGQPLKNRTNIVLSKDKDFKRNGCIVFNSLSDLKKYLKGYDDEKIFVIGGEEIYNLLFPFIKRIYVTKIHKTFKDANKYFCCNLDNNRKFTLTYAGYTMSYDDINFKFLEYAKRVYEA